MAYESIPQKKPGDPLRAVEVNAIGAVVNQFSHSRPGSFMSGMRYSSISGDVGMPPFLQCTVKVLGSGITIDLDNGCSACVARYFDHADGTWKDDDTQYMLDPTDVGLSLSTGDKVSAYWNEQRKAFVPLSGAGSSSTEIWSFVLRTSLSAGGYAIAQRTEYRWYGTCEAESESSGSSSSVSSMSRSESSVSSSSMSASSSSISTSSSSSRGGWDAKRLCFYKDEAGEYVYFIVFDRLNEFTGWADAESEVWTCGFARKLPTTPTYDELCLDQYGVFGEPWDSMGITEVKELERVTCPSFWSCPCGDPDQDPCDEQWNPD